MNLALLNCSPLPEPDPDEAPLLAALRAAGHEAQAVAWNTTEPSDLAVFDAALLRATWDYYHDLPRFLGWLDSVHAVTTVLNPPSMVRANADKRYLRTLEDAGVRIVPTAYFPRGEAADLRAVAARRGWREIVIKPTVGAGSFMTSRFAEGAFDGAQRALDAMLGGSAEGGGPATAGGRDAMMQEYVRSVDEIGERSIVCLAGEPSHAVVKRPRFADQDESVAAFPMTAKELDFAGLVLSALGEAPLYARVDVFDAPDGSLMLSELELIEPSLFFDFGPGSADAFVRALEARVSG